MIKYFEETRLTEFVRTAKNEELAEVHWVELFAGKLSRSDSDGENVSATSLQLIDTVLESIVEPQRFYYVADLIVANFECSLSGSPYDYIDELGVRKSYTGTNFGEFVCSHIKGKVKQRQRIVQVKKKYLESLVEKKVEKKEKKIATDAEEDEKAFLPKELQTVQAIALLEYLRDVGLLDDDFHPTHLGRQRAVVCHLICDELGISNCWKVSSQLTGDNIDTMQTSYSVFKNKQENAFKQFEKKILKIIKEYHKEVKRNHLPH